ncbi:unnamed protein product [Orchesella dallaii]
MRFKVETGWRLNIPISVLLSLILNSSIVQSIDTKYFKRFYFGNLSVDLTEELGERFNYDYLPPQSPVNGVSQKSYGKQSPSHYYHTANHRPQGDQPQKNGTSSDSPPPTTPPKTNQPYIHQDLKTLSKNITNILNSFNVSYDKRVRPNYGGEAVEVGITMFVLSISALSEVEMDFTVDFYFRQMWKDNRLTFLGPKGVDTLSVSSEFLKSMWVPDTFFVNEKTSYFHTATTNNEFLRISQTGDILRSMRLTVCASCPMDLRHFPMDSQLCTIEIESFGYTMSDIRYKWAAGPGSVGMGDVSLPQFKVYGYRQKSYDISLTTGNYSRLACEIQFVRSMGYYLIQIYIPSSLIVVISWVSFWLNRNAAPARVYLGITTVLTMTTLMSSTNKALPKISYVKSIDVYLGTCFVMVFAALLEYATVGYLAKRIQMRKNHFAALQKMALQLQKSCEEHVQKQYYPTTPQTPAPQTPHQQQQQQPQHAGHSTPHAGASRTYVPTTPHQQQHAHSTPHDFHGTPRFVESSTLRKYTSTNNAQYVSSQGGGGQGIVNHPGMGSTMSVAPYYSTQQQQQAGSVTQQGGGRNYDHQRDPRYYDAQVYNPGNPNQYYGGAPPPPQTQAAPYYTQNTWAQESSGCSRAASVKRRNPQPEVEPPTPHYAPQQTQQPSSSIEITPAPGGDKIRQLIPINPNQICGITPSDIDK